ncbi:hypothetical protein GCM10010123_16230 [Pilimelia anulata]|uniref:Uncharacterized protein n=1 Tax=Pilimelia anulata TaxID=53371 RepID=A0A8J3B9K6_9ACTN|nr:hypothetical protein [Pilimelia anulata]GGJ87383.1 hypothetical protein GCM10010123_16230 [Pilimelia anulata]
MNAAPRRPGPRRSGRAGGDAGATLAEVVVSMGITTVVLTLVAAGLVLISRSISRTEGLVDAQERTGLAFTRLDSDVRYAADIADPAVVGGAPTVTYLVTVGAAGPQCRQLRLAGDRLERRAWPQGRPAAGGWSLVAARVAAAPPPPTSAPADPAAAQAAAAAAATGRTAGPFTRYPAAVGGGYQRLELRVRAQDGPDSAARETAVTFTAWNSADGVTGADACAAAAAG